MGYKYRVRRLKAGPDPRGGRIDVEFGVTNNEPEIGERFRFIDAETLDDEDPRNISTSPVVSLEKNVIKTQTGSLYSITWAS